MKAAEKKIRELLSPAGIIPNGPNTFDPKVYDERLYARVLAGGALAAGEAYMDGWWDAKDLPEFFNKIFHTDFVKHIRRDPATLLLSSAARVRNLQSRARSSKVAEKHYDLGNELYMSFLDPYNQYTCGYFKDTDDLNVAQEQKLDLICRKLQLGPKDRVLDIGCGWGGFAKYAAEHFGCHVTGISISDKQIEYAREFCKGLPVTILKQDYRDLEGAFDKVLICGMLEHVGYKNYRALLQTVHRVLKDDGLFLLHTIGANVTRAIGNPWLHAYIFPNGMIPSIRQLGASFEKLFVMEDWHNFGADYDKTLLAWFENFDAAWPGLQEKYGGERFYRMWKYYLLVCAGSFRARANGLWQIVLSKGGVPGGYVPVR